MMTRLARLFCVVAAAAAATGAGAQSLKSLRAQDAEEAALSREVAYTNSVCGSDMDASIDWGASAGWPEEESLTTACDGALGALEAICRSGAGKARASSLSSFVCAGDGSGPSLSGSAFRYGATPGGDGFSETASYLDGEL
jgi:hypothetical protein